MSKFSNVARGAMATALLIGLTGCGGGGGSDDPPQSGNPPAPAPSPPPAPPPAPPPSTPVPPLSSTVIDLTANQQIGATRWGSAVTDGNPIGGFDCIVNPPDAYSVYAHLTIMVNGEAQAIPRYVGAAPTGQTHCFYPVHTHDFSGKVHVSAAAAGTYTLGQLFQFWGQPLTNTNVAGITGLPVEVFVTDNGTVTRVADTEWANIEITNRREITIGLGTPLTEIPNYTWTD